MVKEAIEWIKNNCVSVNKTGKRAWMTVGPGLLTRIYNTQKYKKMVIFPSYYFLPIHCTSLEYKGHGKIYAYQEWGSTKQNYDIMNTIKLPIQFLNPPDKDSVSILISSLNTKAKHLQECLESIKIQVGHFNMEIVWINDGSDALHTALLKNILERFESSVRFTKIKYIENEKNMGLGYSLNKGLKESSHEIVLRMDADDIMYENRIEKQVKFMKETPDCILCGSQVNMFKELKNMKSSIGITSHSNMSVETFLENKPHWLMNHPTFCFRRKEILDIGSYNKDIHSMCEDFELILRVLKAYRKIYNIQEPLLYYRLHENQVTHAGGKEGGEYWTKKRNDLINDILLNN